jgi:pimeloyl-ACP methyl ester carboxylesterase
MADALKPFEQLSFKDVPDRPKKPHDYAETRVRTLELSSRQFGKHAVHVREMGDESAPPLVLIHGLMTTSYSWRYVYKPLSARFRVIAPDLPGCGRSDKPDAPSYEASALATWVADFMDAMGVRGAPIVGNSLGGYVSLRLALDEPEATSRVCVIHAPLFPEVRYAALRAALTVPGTRTALMRWMKRDPLKWAHANVHYFDETLKSIEEAHEYGDPLATPEGGRAFTRYLRETASPGGFASLIKDVKARKGVSPVPLLFLYARKDPMVRPENGPRIAELLPDARFLWMDDTSHFPQVDSPERLVALIFDWMP